MIPLELEERSYSELVDSAADLLTDIADHKVKHYGRSSTAYELDGVLRYDDLPAYDTVLRSRPAISSVASSLYRTKEDHIGFEDDIDRNFYRRVSRIGVDVFGRHRNLYVKQSWEGLHKEAIGLELSNLLTDSGTKYVITDDMLVTEEIMGDPSYGRNVDLSDPAYAYEFGKWETFAELMNFSDRQPANVRWDGEHLNDIDYGQFMSYTFKHTLPEPDRSVTGQVRAGRDDARKTIVENINKHSYRVKSLFTAMVEDYHNGERKLCFGTPEKQLRRIADTLRGWK